MKIKIYKRDFKNATSDIQGKVYLPWHWDEMQALDKMWPDESPIEIDIESAPLLDIHNTCAM
jgi:hypothetical protein